MGRQKESPTSLLDTKLANNIEIALKHIRLGFGSLNKRSYTVQRANITVLPLLAEVKAD